MNAISVEKRKLDLNIHESLTDVFIEDVLASYKLLVEYNSLPLIPYHFFMDDGEFFSAFESVELLCRVSVQRYMFPPEKWGKLNEEEQEEVDEEVFDFNINFEDQLFDDVTTILDYYQLFYLRAIYPSELNNGDTVMEIEEVHNSPLQEVW